jgi:presequence protease
MMTGIYGFTLLKEQEIPELNTRARLFRHNQTGAELLSLENEDENKVFSINFRTPPADSNGIAHIMEHSVLCGSEKYPVKEPFVELLKGSLATFVNAFTFPDKTCYPVASQNVQDFYNLIDVYLDAVFHPNITPQTLEQEGWHYELEQAEDPLTFKGVVFNEMKGAYSSPDNLLGRYSQQAIFPDNTYGVDSGGDPEEIPNLTYAQFMSFHQNFYHPSNARIFFYGDDDPDERLRRMDEALREYSQNQVDSSVPLQPRFSEPRQMVIRYDAGSDDDGSGAKKTLMTVSWMLSEAVDPVETLALDILSYALLGTPASPLRKALIESGLGEDLTGGGLEDHLRQRAFSTGLKGIAREDVSKVEELIFDTLRQLAEDGIDPDTLAAAMNTVEFALRENNTGSFPRGLALMLRVLTTWNYDGDPLAPLAFEAPLQAIKDRLNAGEPLFSNLIRAHLLENPHRATVILEPDPQAAAQKEAAERARLDEARASLDAQDLEALVQATHSLKLRQETPDSPEALATIPTMQLDDLERQNKTIPIEVEEFQGAQVLSHDLFTNGILYLDLAFDLHTLPERLLPYTSLFGRSLVEMGTESEDYVRLSQRIGRSTGGIRTTTFTSARRGASRSTAWLVVRGKSTRPNTGELLNILRDVLLTVRLDNRERFHQMVLEEKAGRESGLIPGGHMVVDTRLRAQFDEAGWASEQMGGVNYLFFLRELAQRVEEDWPGVLADLEEIRRLLITRQGMLANTTIDGESWNAFRPALHDFLASLPAAQVETRTWQSGSAPTAEGLTIPAQVNYVGKGARLYDLGYELDGSVLVINKYLRTTWLWDRVRVQGGAYGGFSVFDRQTGVFTFLSYRDPNLLGTLENYDGTARFLKTLDLSQEELTKSIIGAIGAIDAYQLPDAKGYTSMQRYLIGETDEERQQLREEVLSASQADFRQFGDVLERLNASPSVVVLGSADAIAKANEARAGWLDVKKVL